MAKIKLENIIFWIIILIIIVVIIWILSGSPPLENSLPSLIIFVITSEILLWKALFSSDKKVEVGFMKVKNDLEIIKIKIDSKFNELGNKLDNFEVLAKNKKVK